MKYILNENVALRSWIFVPYAYYIKHQRNAIGLKKDEFELLALCDGTHEIEKSQLLDRLVEIGLCKEAKNGERLSEWQKHLNCDNRYMPAMNWQITGKCNYNCLHCFNAVDNSPLMKEWILEEAEKMLDDAAKCGINAFTITGGEPMIHKNFMDIIRGIYAREMYVEELNTNGYFINQEILDRLKEIGCVPLMKISFDGVGHHDWLRNKKGAEETALKAIRLCVENDFPVMVQTNVHRKNVDSMLETAKLMDSIGVQTIRIIRTTESLRWEQNAKDATLDVSEYYDKMLEFAESYRKTSCKAEVIIWQFLNIYPVQKAYKMNPVAYQEWEYRDSLPVCKGNRGMIAVGADGQIYPCHQMSGYFDAKGWDLGSIKTDNLQKILKESNYLTEVCATVKQLKDNNPTCGNCEYFKYCCGGCRAIGICFTGDKFGADTSKCLFFRNGYYQKTKATMGDWRNLSPVRELEKND